MLPHQPLALAQQRYQRIEVVAHLGTDGRRVLATQALRGSTLAQGSGQQSTQQPALDAAIVAQHVLEQPAHIVGPAAHDEVIEEQAFIRPVLEDMHPGPLRRVLRQQGRRRKLPLKVSENGGAVDDTVAVVLQHRGLAAGADGAANPADIRGCVVDDLEFQALEIQGSPHLRREGRDLELMQQQPRHLQRPGFRSKCLRAR